MFPRRMLVVAAAALAALALVPIFSGGGLGVRGAGAAAPVFRTNNFSVDPRWEAVNNRPDPLIPCGLRSFDFGWSKTKNAGGTLNEIGGRFMRSMTYKGYYGKVLSPVKTLSDTLVASGKLNVTFPTSGTALFGWFNSQTSRDWRANDFVGLRINGTGEGTGAGDNKLEIYGELGSKNNFGVDDVFVGRDSAEVIPAGKPLSWKIEYLPAVGTYGTLKLTVQIPGKTWVRSALLSRIQRQDGATLDRFGFLTSQLDNDKPMFLYVDDLVLDGVASNFTADPLWQGSNNHLASSTECAVMKRNDFGFATTGFAGGGTGEIGGLIWHSSKKASYSDPTAVNLGLKDTLYATGRIVMRQGNPDSDFLLGWFNSTTKDWPAKYKMKNVVGALVGGITDTGFRLFPVYQTKDGTGKEGTTSQSPMLTPKSTSKAFWICYKPPVLATADGTLTVGIDPVKLTIKVTKADRDKGASLNRFGIVNFGDGQGAAETVFLDDLRYTVGPGDTAPAAQCGGL